MLATVGLELTSLSATLRLLWAIAKKLICSKLLLYKLVIYDTISHVLNLFHSLFHFSGAQGEYAGLMAIMSYLKSIGQSNRKVSQQKPLLSSKLPNMTALLPWWICDAFWDPPTLNLMV